MKDRLVFPLVLLLALLASAVALRPRIRRAMESPPPAPPAEPIAEPAEPEPPAPAPPASAPPAPPPPPAHVRVDPASATACRPGMVLVDGIYCPFVAHRCARFVDEDKDICGSYSAEVICEGALQHRRFCIDVFEYPNLEGVKPAVMVDYNDAVRGCRAEGKRLCTTDEWQFACEGTEMWPYPYGRERDAAACNIDRPHAVPDAAALDDPRRISEEVERLDQRAPSGQRAGCVSPFGVRDMTGNVDEWTENPEGKRTEKPFRSALKGGYWGAVRARCRPVTTTHSEHFSYYQVGFRCCSDTTDGARPVRRAGR